MKTIASRTMLFRATGAFVATVLASGGALAQEAAGQGQAEDPVTLDSVVVTGSRIARPEIDAAVPIAVLNAEDFERDGTVNVQDILREMPQIGVGTTRTNSNFSDTAMGVATVDMRNLGPSRTLVLVNGRRYVPGMGGTSAVDLNNIPADFIERVEVITGGASAVYGSDAISGVVNFVLKEGFEGATAHAQYGISSRDDNERVMLSLTGGTRWGVDDRGHVMVNLTHDSEKGVLSRDRAFSREDRSLALVGVPAYSSYAPQGRFDLRTVGGTSAQVFTFDHDNNLVYGFPQELAYNRNWDRRIAVPVERTMVSAVATFDVSDSARFFVEPTYSRVESNNMMEAYSFDWSFVYRDGQPGMPITNAYIPGEIRALIDARNSDADPANDINGIQFRRRQNEVYDRSHSAERETFRIATGFTGEFGNGWKYETSYVFGRMKDSTHSEDIDVTRYLQALDSIVDPSSGDIICRSEAARAEGCLPINLFGFNTVRPETTPYVMVPRYVVIENIQHVLSGSVTGTVFTLPAGDVQVAVGGEYRREKSSTDWDPITNAGDGTSFGYDDLVGSFRVHELFAEAHVPLLADAPLAKRLDLNLAARYADYSTIGTALSWNVGLEYAPFSSLRFRANYAEANRAPNISELYSVITGGAGGATIVDPCAGTSATSNRPQDDTCRAIPGLLQQAAEDGGELTYTSFDLNWMSVVEGGNPDLQEETAKTLTLGAVFSPERVPGMNLSVDYFRIRIADAIGAMPGQVVVDRCIELGDPFYCDNVERYPTGKLRGIETRLVNVANLETSGVDLGFAYSRNLGWFDNDRLGLNLLYTRLLSLEKQSYPNAPVEENLGQLYAEGRLGSGFKNRGTARLSYTAGGFTASWQTTFLGEIQDRLNWTPPAGPDQDYLDRLNHVGNHFYHDLQFGYAFERWMGLELYAGINNVSDKSPPLLPAGFASSVTSVESAKEYDPFGRRYYLGVRYRF